MDKWEIVEELDALSYACDPWAKAISKYKTWSDEEIDARIKELTDKLMQETRR